MTCHIAVVSKVVFNITLKSQIFLLLILFLLLFINLITYYIFLVLFMGSAVLFQLLFSFTNCTFSKRKF